jgi:aerotaxis receptor
VRKNLPVTNIEHPVPEEATILSTTDRKGRITYVNPDFVQISGFATEELLGEPHNIVRHPDMPRAAFADLWATLHAGRSWIGMVKNRCRNGDFYWVDAFVTPVFTNGELTEYQSVRIRPAPEAVHRATALYRRLSSGRRGFRFPWPVPGMTSRLLAVLTVVVLAAAWGLLRLAGVGLPAVASALGPAYLLGVGLIALVTLPVRRLAARARRMHHSDLAAHVYTGRRDDLGQIELALKMSESRLKSVVGRIEDSTSHVTGLAAQTANVVRDSSRSVAELKSETDMVAAAMHEMATSVAEVARTTSQAAEAATLASDATRRGRTIVGQVKDAIDTLSREVDRAAETLQRLEAESSNIGMVLKVIQDIAQQTNLLALNATIEAAHAGDRGKGFAVVAESVRALAGQTRDSAQQISRIVQGLQGYAREASAVMLEGRRRAQHTVAEATEARSALDAIDRAIGQMRGMNLQIASAAEEQSTVAADISRNVVTISQQSGVVAAGADEVASTSNSLAGLSAGLQALVGQFRRDGRVTRGGEG